MPVSMDRSTQASDTRYREPAPSLSGTDQSTAWSRLWPPLFVGGFAVLTRVLNLLAVGAGAHTGVGGALRYIGVKWDAYWYAFDVLHPYSTSTLYGRVGIGFYPGYPLLAWLVHQPLRLVSLMVVSVPSGETVWWSLLIVSNACLVVALVALWRLFLPRLGTRGTMIGLALFLAAPGSFVLSAGFSESAFIAASALAFLFAERRRWVLCGVFTGVAAFIRLDGALLLLPLGLLWLIADRRVSVQAVVGLAAALLGVAAYPWFLGMSFGDPLLYVTTKDKLWGNHWALVPTVVAMLTSIPYGVHLVLTRSSPTPLPAHTGAHARLFGGLVLLNAGTALTGLLTIPISWIGLGLPYALWVLLAVLAPLSSGLDAGLTRYTLAAWPVYFALGWLLRRTPAVVPVIIVGLSLIGMLVVSFDFSQGYFVV